MYRFLQKHGKKIMAVFGALLMVTMALPSATNFSRGGSDLVGKIDGEKLQGAEYRSAYAAWELMSRTPFIDPRQPTSAQPMTLVVLGPEAVGQIREHPLLFLLLQKEAQRMGVGVSQDALNGAIANIPSLKTGDPERDEELKAAFAQLLLVRQAYARATSTLKVSDPLIAHHLAAARQSITLTAAEFTAAQYTGKVPPISAEQLKAQFEKYADVLKGSVNANNPAGFGYKYPDRLKLQYISISRPAVRKFVEDNSAPGKPKDRYEWEVEAQKYYRQHQSEFPTSQPAAAATTQGAASRPAVAAGPTTKPFAEVRDQIVKQLIDAETDKKMAQIQDRIAGTLAADWAAYRAATATTMPATLPKTALGVPYDSVDYLQKLALHIQSTYGVLPIVQSIADRWLNAEDLSKLPGIGQAVRPHQVQALPMPIYLIGMTAPFVQEKHRNQPDVLQVLEPTRPMRDATETTYIARVSATDPSHKPASLAEVEGQVRTDAIMMAAYDLARADAAALLKQAKEKDLKTAAGSKSLIKVGPLTREPGPTVPGLPLTGASVNDFLVKAFKLLRTTSSQPAGKPTDLIEVQRDGRVFVAELTDVQAMWNAQTRGMEEADAIEQIQREFQQRFNQDWFNYDSVASRLKFVPEGDVSPKDLPVRPQEPPAPMF